MGAGEKSRNPCRNANFRLPKICKFAIFAYLLFYRLIHEFFARDGDKVIINKMLENIQQVEMIGQVKRPGSYSYYNDMSLYDLIDLGGGFNDSTFWKSVYYSRAQIIRRNPKTRYESVIEINIKDALEGNGPDNISLENLDRVFGATDENSSKIAKDILLFQQIIKISSLEKYRILVGMI